MSVVNIFGRPFGQGLQRLLFWCRLLIFFRIAMGFIVPIALNYLPLSSANCLPCVGRHRTIVFRSFLEWHRLSNEFVP